MTEAALWVGIFLFISVIMLFQGFMAARRRRRSVLAERLGIVDREELLEAAAEEATGIQGHIIRMGRRMAPQEVLEQTQNRIRWAGLNMKAEQLYGIRVTAAFLSAGFMFALTMVGLGFEGMVMTVMVALIGYFAPDVWLKGRVAERHKQVERQLLSFLDMLTVSVESGLNLTDALKQVSDKLGGVLGTEFGIAYQEQRMGASSIDALQKVAYRVGQEELSMIIGNICEALRTGTPIARILRQQSEQLREMRRLRATELAQKMSGKLLIVVALCTFMPLLVIVIGPAVIQMFKALSGM